MKPTTILKAAGDDNHAAAEIKEHETLTLTSVYANNRQEVHFTVYNVEDKLLENQKDYRVTVESVKDGVADLNSLINADTYKLGLQITKYEGLDAAFADGRISFVIEQYPLDGKAITGASLKVDPVTFVGIKSFLYDGTVIKPVPVDDFTVRDLFNNTLVYGEDYTLDTVVGDKNVAYSKIGKNAGRYPVIIKANGGNYTGSFDLPFTVGKRPLDQVNIKIANRYYDAKAKIAVTLTPDDVSAFIGDKPVTLLNRDDYNFVSTTSASAADLGTAFTASGIGEHQITLSADKSNNFERSKKVTFKLVENNIGIAVLHKLENASYDYTGLPINPLTNGTLNIRPDLKEDTDYKLVYSTDNRTDANKSITVYVQGIGA